MNTDKTRLLAFICVYLCSSVVSFCHEPITTKVTWNKEVVRILGKHCLGCHRDGGIAPMSLSKYDEARPWAKAIKEEILEHRMPVWHAAHGFADFANNRGLTLLETELLVDWVEGGAPKGEDKDLPSPAATPPNWLGSPDLVLKASDSSTDLKTDRYIRAWEFHPAKESAQEQAEFWMVLNGQRTYLGNWVAPDNLTILPERIGILLKAGSRVLIVAKVREGEEAPKTPGTLDLYFTKSQPEHRLMQRKMACGSSPLAAGIELVAVRPLQSLEMIARLPDGAVEPLGLFREGKQTFRLTYRYREPIRLPLGTKIEVRSAEPGANCGVQVSYIARK